MSSVADQSSRANSLAPLVSTGEVSVSPVKPWEAGDKNTDTEPASRIKVWNFEYMISITLLVESNNFNVLNFTEIGYL